MFGEFEVLAKILRIQQAVTTVFDASGKMANKSEKGEGGMKNNLKNFPKLNADPTTNEQQIIQWKEGFEKELRDFRASYEKDLRIGHMRMSQKASAEKWIFIINEILGEENYE